MYNLAVNVHSLTLDVDIENELIERQAWISKFIDYIGSGSIHILDEFDNLERWQSKMIMLWLKSKNI